MGWAGGDTLSTVLGRNTGRTPSRRSAERRVVISGEASCVCRFSKAGLCGTPLIQQTVSRPAVDDNGTEQVAGYHSFAGIKQTQQAKLMLNEENPSTKVLGFAVTLAVQQNLHHTAPSPPMLRLAELVYQTENTSFWLYGVCSAALTT